MFKFGKGMQRIDADFGSYTQKVRNFLVYFCYNSFPCGLCRRVSVGKYENPRFSYKLVS